MCAHYPGHEYICLWRKSNSFPNFQISYANNSSLYSKTVTTHGNTQNLLCVLWSRTTPARFIRHSVKSAKKGDNSYLLMLNGYCNVVVMSACCNFVFCTLILCCFLYFLYNSNLQTRLNFINENCALNPL